MGLLLTVFALSFAGGAWAATLDLGTFPYLDPSSVTPVGYTYDSISKTFTIIDSDASTGANPITGTVAAGDVVINASVANVVLDTVSGVKAISVTGTGSFKIKGNNNEIGTLIVPAAGAPITLTVDDTNGAHLKLGDANFTQLANAAYIKATDISTANKPNALKIETDSAFVSVLGDSDLGKLMAAVLDSDSKTTFTSLDFYVLSNIVTHALTIGEGVTLTIDTGKTLYTATNTGDITVASGGKIDNLGTIYNEANAKITNNGTITNNANATITNIANAEINNEASGTITNSGTIDSSIAGSIFTNDGTIVKEGSGTLTVDGVGPYTIVASVAGAGGTITPAGNIVVLNNGNQEFAIKPDTSYVISDVVVDSVSQGAISTHKFESVTDNGTIQATFKYTAEDPGETDPGKTDPGKTDPGKTDPDKTDPYKTDPDKTDPGETDPGKKGSSSGGGCNAGFGAATLLLIAASLFLKKRG
ncbi:hypothetical protein AGMMS49957_11400 [Synergistales bacterium]|nr:hypothetical protein AGMMS49957_11400 [Synergistales bacterium]